MKRDLQLIRKLVLAIEDIPTGYVNDDIQIEGFSKEEIAYHAYLLVDAGYAKGIEITNLTDTSPQWRILHLTSAGHDFADAARSESNWKKAMDLIKEKTGGITLDVLKQLMIGIMKNTLGV